MSLEIGKLHAFKDVTSIIRRKFYENFVNYVENIPFLLQRLLLQYNFDTKVFLITVKIVNYAFILLFVNDFLKI